MADRAPFAAVVRRLHRLHPPVSNPLRLHAGELCLAAPRQFSATPAAAAPYPLSPAARPPSPPGDRGCRPPGGRCRHNIAPRGVKYYCFSPRRRLLSTQPHVGAAAQPRLFHSALLFFCVPRRPAIGCVCARASGGGRDASWPVGAVARPRDGRRRRGPWNGLARGHPPAAAAGGRREGLACKRGRRWPVRPPSAGGSAAAASETACGRRQRGPHARRRSWSRAYPSPHWVHIVATDRVWTCLPDAPYHVCRARHREQLRRAATAALGSFPFCPSPLPGDAPHRSPTLVTLPFPILFPC